MPTTHDSKGRPQAVCIGCNKTPEQIPEYVDEAQIAAEETGREWTPDDFVWDEEGTLNHSNGHFLCTACYIAAKMPATARGWEAP